MKNIKIYKQILNIVIKTILNLQRKIINTKNYDTTKIINFYLLLYCNLIRYFSKVKNNYNNKYYTKERYDRLEIDFSSIN